MEELEIGDYINDINSYHLHMFDKHDVTTKKFDAIVEKAGKVDANYAAQIEGYCSLLGEYGKKFETVCAMLALDLIGVKVFRYSDETAEAVASGEKLLKESGTIYESFADMMSPEDAKRYLDFLENGSREGLTSAELADALLVSQKVGYEDVWDLGNVGDALESGSSTIHNDILDSPRTGSALKVDDVNPIYKINEKTGKRQIVKEFPATAQSHGFNDIVDNYAGYATQTPLNNATLYQLDGSLNGVAGRFEWIIQDGNVTHRMFIQNGTMNGVPIKS